MSIDETMFDTDGIDDSQVLEIEAEDEPGFVQVGHWVLFNYYLSPVARCLYGQMAAYVNRIRRRRGDTDVWPTLPMLAVLIGVGTGDQVTPYLDELVQAGAIVRRATYDPKGRRTRNRYGVRFNPPAAHTNNLGVIMAHLRPIASKKENVAAEAKHTKAIIKIRREQAKNERAAGLAEPPSLSLPPYPLTVPDSNGKTAGQGVPEKTGVRTPKNSGAYPKKLGSNNTQVPTTGSREKQGEEEDARARETAGSSSEGWGVQPAATAQPAIPAPEPNGVAAQMIGAVARRLGEHLTPEQHQVLAAKYEAAVAVVQAMMAERVDVHPSHLPEYIDAGYHRPDGTPTYESLYAVLGYRLTETQVRDKLPGFVARTANTAPSAGPSGGGWGTGGPAPSQGSTHGRCLIHGVAYIPDRSGFGLHCPRCSFDEDTPPAPDPITLGPRTVLDALPDPEPQNRFGEHCGNNACNREQRTILKRAGDRVWAEPCPLCRPGEGGLAQ